MKTRYPFCIIILSGLILALLSACGGARSTQEQENVNLSLNSINGLESFNSYHNETAIQIVGIENGNEFQKTTTVTREFINHGKAELTIVDTLNDLGEPVYFFVAEEADIQYSKDRADMTCQSVKDANLEYSNPIPNPVSLLPSVNKAKEAGEEVVNGVLSTHYTFDQINLEISDTVQAVGDYWLANEGDFLVKYQLVIQAPKDVIREGFEGEISYEYDLTQVNALTKLNLPTDCLPVLEEVPVMSDAVNVVRWPNLIEYSTSSSLSQVESFYRQELGASGYTESGDPDQLEGETILWFDHQTINSFDQALVTLEPMDGLVYVQFFFLSIDFPEILNATATPEIIEGSKGSDLLPADVPIYNGAFDITDVPGVGVVFFVNDPYETVADFYQTQLTANGWHLESETPLENAVALMWSKEGKTLMVSCTQTDTGTEVMLVIN